MLKMVKCVKSIEDFKVNEFLKLNIGVEIQDFTRFSLDESIESKVDEYKKMLNGFKNIISIHGPFLDLRPASPDPDIRRVSYSKYIKALNIAKELQANYIVFHSQINPYLNEPCLNNLMNSKTREFWLEILSESDYKGMVLIENVFEDSPQMLKEYIETVNIPNIRVNIDIGHAKLKGNPLEEWIIELRKYIEYIHIHSNNGKYDEHKSPSQYEIKELNDLTVKYNINPVYAIEYAVDDIEKEISRYETSK